MEKENEFREKFTFQVYNYKDIDFCIKKGEVCFYIGIAEACKSNPNKF